MTISAMGLVPGFAFGECGCRRRGGCGTWGQALGRDVNEQAVVRRPAPAGKAPKDAATVTGERDGRRVGRGGRGLPRRARRRRTHTAEVSRCSPSGCFVHAVTRCDRRKHVG